MSASLQCGASHGAGPWIARNGCSTRSANPNLSPELFSLEVFNLKAGDFVVDRRSGMMKVHPVDPAALAERKLDSWSAKWSNCRTAVRHAPVRRPRPRLISCGRRSSCAGNSGAFGLVCPPPTCPQGGSPSLRVEPRSGRLGRGRDSCRAAVTPSAVRPQRAISIGLGANIGPRSG